MTTTNDPRQLVAGSGAPTLGPWFVNPVDAFVEAHDAPICAMLWPTELRSEDETFANARLIAAAPDLLAALEALRGGIGAASLVRNKHGQQLRAQADAAIARAKGTPS